MRLFFVFLMFIFAPLSYAEWTHCANEYGKGEPNSCSWNDLRTVRFGNGEQWVYEDKFDGLAAYKCAKSNFPSADFEWSGGPYRCEYFSETVTKKVIKPNHCASRNDCSGMPEYLPAGEPSSHITKVKPTTASLTPDDILGAFRTECKFSHFAYDDPLVYPNMSGMSHLHMFFGNDSTNAYSDTSNLAGVGGSTCDGGTLNRSAYWTPALLDTNRRVPILPVKTLWYYKGGYQGLAKVGFPNLPKGLGMIGREFVWSCSSNSSTRVDHIPTCSAGNYLNLAIKFPQCWDGQNLWLSGSTHVVNPEDSQCPETHPVPLPRITVTMKFFVEYEGQDSHLALSSDMMQNPGSSAHADWINGWDEETSSKFIKNCLNKLNDCHYNNLGDGTTLHH